MLVRGKRYSILAARNMYGMMDFTIHTKVNNTVRFCKFLKNKVIPHLNRKSVLFMDNASIHKSKLFRAFARYHKLRVIYLAPYSPHTNPIELDFNTVKSYLKRRRGFAYKHPRRSMKKILNKLKYVNVKSVMKRMGY